MDPPPLPSPAAASASITVVSVCMQTSAMRGVDGEMTMSSCQPLHANCRIGHSTELLCSFVLFLFVLCGEKQSPDVSYACVEREGRGDVVESIEGLREGRC